MRPESSAYKFPKRQTLSPPWKAFEHRLYLHRTYNPECARRPNNRQPPQPTTFHKATNTVRLSVLRITQLKRTPTPFPPNRLPYLQRKVHVHDEICPQRYHLYSILYLSRLHFSDPNWCASCKSCLIWLICLLVCHPPNHPLKHSTHVSHLRNHPPTQNGSQLANENDHLPISIPTCPDI